MDAPFCKICRTKHWGSCPPQAVAALRPGRRVERSVSPVPTKTAQIDTQSAFDPKAAGHERQGMTPPPEGWAAFDAVKCQEKQAAAGPRGATPAGKGSGILKVGRPGRSAFVGLDGKFDKKAYQRDWMRRHREKKG